MEIFKDLKGVLDTVITMENKIKSISLMSQLKGINRNNKPQGNNKNIVHKEIAKITILRVILNNPQIKTIALMNLANPTTNSISMQTTKKRVDNIHKQSVNICLLFSKFSCAMRTLNNTQ